MRTASPLSAAAAAGAITSIADSAAPQRRNRCTFRVFISIPSSRPFRPLGISLLCLYGTTPPTAKTREIL